MAKYPGYDVRGSGQYAVVCHYSKVVEIFWMKDNAENAIKKGCKHGAIHELIFMPFPPAPKNDHYGFDSHV